MEIKLIASPPHAITESKFNERSAHARELGVGEMGLP